MATIGSTPKLAYVYDSQTDTWVLIGTPDHTHPYIASTLVDNKGDLITATANDTPAILSKGSDGTILVSDSTTSTGLAWQPYAAQFVAGKNAIINGGFDIWQRGTSFNTANVYTADRWAVGNITQAFTVSQQSPGSTLSQFKNCARFQRNSGQTGTGSMDFFYTLETLDSLRFAGQTVTVSFYARAGSNYSPTSSILPVTLYSGTGTDQKVTGFTALTGVSSTNATLTTSWQRFSFTGTVGSTATQLGIYFSIAPTGTAGANDFYELTGVQLEIGSVSTPFSRATGTLQGELAACQRYCLNFSINAAPAYFLNGIARSTTVATCYFPSPVEMRVVPTSIDVSGFRIFNSQNGIAYNGGTTTLEAYNNKIFQVNYTHGTAVFTNGTSIIGGFDATSSYIRFNAEL